MTRECKACGQYFTAPEWSPIRYCSPCQDHIREMVDDYPHDPRPLEGDSADDARESGPKSSGEFMTPDHWDDESGMSWIERQMFE